MLRLEARSQPSKAMSLASPLLALLVTVLIGVVMFALLGKDPLRALQMFFWEPIKSAYAWTEIAVKATPLILIGLGLAICYRSNVWNIGAEGQYVIGAVLASGVAMQATADTPRAIVLVILLAGIVGGMVWAGIVALLRDRFNANEILVSLMLVYVALMVLSYLVYGPWKDPKGYNFPQTITFAAPTKVPRLVDGLRLNIGVLIALAAVALAWLFLFRTYRGFGLQVGGLAPAAARYAGFSASTSLWTALLISGGLAGLAGGIEAIGTFKQITPHVSTGLGFTAIIVCFVGRLHPVG
ncbi:MAG TPA: ABC transporter permease, partial [Burkholderiaceae bacterium]